MYQSLNSRHRHWIKLTKKFQINLKGEIIKNEPKSNVKSFGSNRQRRKMDNSKWGTQRFGKQIHAIKP